MKVFYAHKKFPFDFAKIKKYIKKYVKFRPATFWDDFLKFAKRMNTLLNTGE